MKGLYPLPECPPDSKCRNSLRTDWRCRWFRLFQKYLQVSESWKYALRRIVLVIIAAAGWRRAECCIAGFGSMAGDLRACAGPQGHCRIPQSRQDFR